MIVRGTLIQEAEGLFGVGLAIERGARTTAARVLIQDLLELGGYLVGIGTMRRRGGHNLVC